MAVKRPRVRFLMPPFVSREIEDLEFSLVERFSYHFFRCQRCTPAQFELCKSGGQVLAVLVRRLDVTNGKLISGTPRESGWLIEVPGQLAETANVHKAVLWAHYIAEIQFDRIGKLGSPEAKIAVHMWLKARFETKDVYYT